MRPPHTHRAHTIALEYPGLCPDTDRLHFLWLLEDDFIEYDQIACDNAGRFLATRSLEDLWITVPRLCELPLCPPPASEDVEFMCCDVAEALQKITFATEETMDGGLLDTLNTLWDFDRTLNANNMDIRPRVLAELSIAIFEHGDLEGFFGDSCYSRSEACDAVIQEMNLIRDNLRIL